MTYVCPEGRYVFKYNKRFIKKHSLPISSHLVTFEIIIIANERFNKKSYTTQICALIVV